MLPEVILYAIFTLLSVVGVYLIAAHFRSRRLGVVLALVTLFFFAALAVWLRWLMTTYGG